MMSTYINRHWGELDQEVLTVLEAHPELWDSITKEDLLHTDFYDILDDGGNLLGFFGNAHWNGDGITECVLCCAYVKPEHRGKGLFNKMVKFTISHNQDARLITIGAKADNYLANAIYSKKFEFSHFDEETNGNLYFIKDRR